LVLVLKLRVLATILAAELLRAVNAAAAEPLDFVLSTAEVLISIAATFMMTRSITFVTSTMGARLIFGTGELLHGAILLFPVAAVSGRHHRHLFPVRMGLGGVSFFRIRWFASLNLLLRGTAGVGPCPLFDELAHRRRLDL
jgi:hypothetical protein